MKPNDNQNVTWLVHVPHMVAWTFVHLFSRPSGKRPVGDLCAEGRIKLKWIWHKQCGILWNGFMQAQWNAFLNVMFNKEHWISSLVEWLLSVCKVRLNPSEYILKTQKATLCTQNLEINFMKLLPQLKWLGTIFTLQSLGSVLGRMSCELHSANKWHLSRIYAKFLQLSPANCLFCHCFIHIYHCTPWSDSPKWTAH
jgi:hypothetical protein